MTFKAIFSRRVLIFCMIGITLLTGCADPTQNSSSSEESKKESPIEIETSEAAVKNNGLELMGVEIVNDGGLFSIVSTIKNHSIGEYEALELEIKYYDEVGAVIGTGRDIGRNVEPGEVWKSEILESRDKGIAKIEIVELRAIGAEDDKDEGNTNNLTYEEVVVKCAQTLVYQNIKAPATAQWVSADILEKDTEGRYLVDVVLDAENSFGALIRSSFIVALQSVEESGKFTHSPMFFMKEYSREFERTQAIDYIMSMNDWNESKEKEAVDKPDGDTPENSNADTGVEEEAGEFAISSWEAIEIVEKQTGFQYADSYDTVKEQYSTEPESIQIFGTFCWIIPVMDPKNAMYAGELYVDANTGVIYNMAGERPWN